MLGCVGGAWLMGQPYKQPLSHNLSRTIVPGAFPSQGTVAEVEAFEAEIMPEIRHLNVTAATPAECYTLVRRDHPTATAALYSNVSQLDELRFSLPASLCTDTSPDDLQLEQDWCQAVFGALGGVSHSSEVQTCLFE